MSDNELVNLLMQSPLYQKLQNIRDRMSGVEPSKPSKDQKDQGKIFFMFGLYGVV